MERAASFTHDDTAQAKLDKLMRCSRGVLRHRQDAALLAEMLSLPIDGGYRNVGPTPQQRRQRTLEALERNLKTYRNPRRF